MREYNRSLETLLSHNHGIAIMPAWASFSAVLQAFVTFCPGRTMTRATAYPNPIAAPDGTSPYPTVEIAGQARPKPHGANGQGK
jgi:hypothetical protein